jgi:hypothetical protein
MAKSKRDWFVETVITAIVLGTVLGIGAAIIFLGFYQEF